MVLLKYLEGQEACASREHMGKTVYSAVPSACCSETAAEDPRQLFFHWCWNCEGNDLNIELQDITAAVMSDKKM